MNKNAVMTENIVMIYRIFLMSLVALAVLSISSIFYDQYVNVRDTEAVLMSRTIMDCFVSEDFIDVSGDDFDFFDECGVRVSDKERFFIKAKLKIGGVEKELKQGDSGLMWIKTAFDEVEAMEGNDQIKKYYPGFYGSNFKAMLRDGEIKEFDVKLEVLIKDEF
jgi:hypothetical protein